MSRPSGMRISPPVAIVGVLAALSGWMVRGVQSDAEASPVTPQIASAAPAHAAAESEPPLRVERHAYASHATRSTRNLFGYVEQPAPVTKPAVFHPPPVPVVAAPAAIVPQPVERPRAPFTHRYIGRFGPDHRPIAAFARDGQVVTVRVGERIDERFVLRSIDLESVQVEASVDGVVQTERLALTVKK
jgi:hypothetical protein